MEEPASPAAEEPARRTLYVCPSGKPLLRRTLYVCLAGSASHYPAAGRGAKVKKVKKVFYKNKDNIGSGTRGYLIKIKATTARGRHGTNP